MMNLKPRPIYLSLAPFLASLFTPISSTAQELQWWSQYSCGGSEIYPRLTGNNGSCLVELQNERYSECDFRGSVNGTANWMPGTLDTCRDKCIHCCACESDFTEAEELSLRLTCDCLLAAGVTAATSGGGAAAGGPASSALGACLNYQFWIEEIPNILAGVPGLLEDGEDDSLLMDALQEIDWGSISSQADFFINYIYRTKELTGALLDANSLNQSQRAAFGVLARAVGRALRSGKWDLSTLGPLGTVGEAYVRFIRKFQLKNGDVRWLDDASNFTAGTADWIFDFCGKIKEEGNESNRNTCRNECLNSYPADSGGASKTEPENDFTPEDRNGAGGGGWGLGGPGDPFVWSDGGEFPAYMDIFVDPWDPPFE